MNSLSKQLMLFFVAMLLTVIFNLSNNYIAHASGTPDPSVVTVVGSFQDELGCSGDWQPDCTATRLSFDAEDDVWHGGFNIPAGNYEYKIALNDSWDENYGANATPDGPNIPLSLAEPAEVWFYYSHETHWITDNVNSVIAIVAGGFQDDIGCSGDWQPGCLRSWLQDPDGDGLYSFSTSEIPPAWAYEFKWVLHENGENGGVTWSSCDNDVLIMPNYVTEVIFTFDLMAINECEWLDFEIVPPTVPIYDCDEFAPPMANFPVSFKRNHAIPLRANLFDAEGLEMTGDDLVLPPVVQISLRANNIVDSTYLDTELLPTGQGDDGNQFDYTDSGYWELILSTKDDRYKAPGTYEIMMDSGDDSEYLIDPTCITEFVVE